MAPRKHNERRRVKHDGDWYYMEGRVVLAYVEQGRSQCYVLMSDNDSTTYTDIPLDQAKRIAEEFWAIR